MAVKTMQKPIEHFIIDDRGVLPLFANFTFDQSVPEGFDHGVIAAGYSTQDVIERCIESINRKGFDTTVVREKLNEIPTREVSDTELHFIVISWR